MGVEPAEHARRRQSAISADRMFDGCRWHNDAVILIDRGVVQRIVPRNQSADDWPTETMPPGTVLAPGFIDLQVNGGGGILLNDEPTPDAMRAIARAHRRYGPTSCLPTLISDSRTPTYVSYHHTSASAFLQSGTSISACASVRSAFNDRARPTRQCSAILKFVVPHTEAADEGMGIVAGPTSSWQLLHVYEVSTAYYDVLWLQCRDQTVDHVFHELAPAFLADALEAPVAHVIFVGAFLVGQVTEFHRFDNAVYDYRRTEPCS